jgi:hypothetical protein
MTHSDCKEGTAMAGLLALAFVAVSCLICSLGAALIALIGHYAR